MLVGDGSLYSSIISQLLLGALGWSHTFRTHVALLIVVAYDLKREKI